MGRPSWYFELHNFYSGALLPNSSSSLSTSTRSVDVEFVARNGLALMRTGSSTAACEKCSRSRFVACCWICTTSHIVHVDESVTHTSPAIVLESCSKGPVSPNLAMTYLWEKCLMSTCFSESPRGAYAAVAIVTSITKYNGLKSTIIASFHPSTTITPYIQ